MRAMRHPAVEGLAPVLLASLAVIWSVGIFISGFVVPVIQNGTEAFGGTWGGAAVVLGVPAAAALMATAVAFTRPVCGSPQSV